MSTDGNYSKRVYDYVDQALAEFAEGIDGDAEWPRLACAECSDGLVRFANVVRFEDRDSGVDGWSPVSTGTFTMAGRCDNMRCHRDVHIAGDYKTVPFDYDDRYGRPQRDYSTDYFAKFIYPSPRLVTVPISTPGAVKKSIESAATVLLSAPNLAIVALRSAIESLLDAHGVPKRNGKTPMNLHRRIELFPEHSEEPGRSKIKDLSAFLISAKEAGNAGAHETGTIDLADALEMAEIIGETLRRLYAEPRPAIEERAELLKEKFKPRR